MKDSRARREGSIDNIDPQRSANQSWHSPGERAFQALATLVPTLGHVGRHYLRTSHSQSLNIATPGAAK